MASTFSNLGLNLQATGENSGTWGALTNVNLQDIDNAIGGVANVTITGSTTLAFTTNSSSTTYADEAGRNKIIVLFLPASSVNVVDDEFVVKAKVVFPVSVIVTTPAIALSISCKLTLVSAPHVPEFSPVA